MSDRGDVGLDALSATQIENLDALCEHFKRAWQEGPGHRGSRTISAQRAEGGSPGIAPGSYWPPS